VNNPNDQTIPLTKKEKKAALDKKYRAKYKAELKIKRAEYYQNNKERCFKQCSKWRKTNKERYAEKKKEWYKKNKKDHNERSKIYREKNRDSLLNYFRSYYQQNKEHLLVYGKKWRTENKQTIKLQRAKSHQEKYHTDINYKMANLLRGRIWRVLKKNSTIKNQKTKDLTGCDTDFLKLHLESLWEQGMSWENHSTRGWHIDHIIPCAYFNLKDLEEQKKCFHYTNLRPLWHQENLSKSSVYEGVKHYYSK